MVDKDFVAVSYAQGNAERNRIGNARAQLSNGFDQIDRSCASTSLRATSRQRWARSCSPCTSMTPMAACDSGGSLYLVTINGLREFMKRNLLEVFGNYEKVKQGARYTVSLASKTAGPKA